MAQKKIAPDTRSEHAGATSTVEGKDNQIRVGFHENRVLNLLLDGIHRSAADISIALHNSDPRGIIRNLRHKGVQIADEWCDAVHGSRYKRYFIRKGGVQ